MTHARPHDPHDDLVFRMSHDRPELGPDDVVLLSVAFVLRPDPGGASGGVDVHVGHSDRMPVFLPWEALDALFCSATAEAIQHVAESWSAKVAEN